MTKKNSRTGFHLLPVLVTTFVAFALASVAVIVSANTVAPANFQSTGVSASSASDASQERLRAYKLKQNALSLLRAMPDYSQSAPTDSASATVNSPSASSPGVSHNTVAPDANVNVNTFLLSTRISNDSQLSKLQMQPTFAEFDAQLFSPSPNDGSVQSVKARAAKYAGVGFPHIETSDRAESKQYKPYKQLLSFNADSDHIVPNVKCMGLSAERVAKRAEKYDARIFELAVKHRVSANLVKAVVAKESCFNAKAISHAGAIGLMQLMPETAQWLKVSKPENVQQNLSAGVRYLAQLRKRFGSNELALAAYNAGPGNVERYKGIPPFAETENYVQDVMHFYRGYVATTRFVNAQNEY